MASRINYFFVCIEIFILLIILVLVFRIYFSMDSRNIENFNTKNDAIVQVPKLNILYNKNVEANTIKKMQKYNITRIGDGDTSLQPNQCLVQIIVSQNQLDITKTELNKMVKSYANAPINAFSNKINQNGEKLFENYVIKFDDVKRVYNPIDNNQFDDNNYSSNNNNPYNDINPTIHFITTQNNFRLDGLISNLDNAYNIVMKIIRYIGLQTNYQ